VKRDSDTAPYVGHACQECGKRVLVSNEGPTGAIWRTTSEGVKGWHMDCFEKVYEKAAAR